MSNSTISVDDYLEAAALTAAGAELADVRMTPRGRVAFQFEGSEAARLLAEHRRGELRLPSLAVTTALSHVKSRLFAVRGR